MPDAVIVSTARTAIGTSFKGSLLDVDAYELGTLAVAEAVRRAGVDPELVDDVQLGEILYGGGDIARYAAIEAGLVHAPGVAHNRHCASGLSAIQGGAASIRSGMDRVVVAGGAHSSSTSPRCSLRGTVLTPERRAHHGATAATLHRVIMVCGEQLYARSSSARVPRRMTSRRNAALLPR